MLRVACQCRASIASSGTPCLIGQQQNTTKEGKVWKSRVVTVWQTGLIASAVV